MKISTRGRYGIRLMLALALNYNNGTIPLKTIAKDQGISEKYLEQIINPLTKSGLVKSFRGAQGGYMLTNPPEATVNYKSTLERWVHCFSIFNPCSK